MAVAQPNMGSAHPDRRSVEEAVDRARSAVLADQHEDGEDRGVGRESSLHQTGFLEGRLRVLLRRHLAKVELVENPLQIPAIAAQLSVVVEAAPVRRFPILQLIPVGRPR